MTRNATFYTIVQQQNHTVVCRVEYGLQPALQTKITLTCDKSL